MKGPRILFKTDDQSSIGRGCVTYGGHFRREIAHILWVAARTADRSWESITVSEGWRPQDDDGRDLHPELRAFDFSLNHIDGDEDDRWRAGKEWVARMRILLGPDYQIQLHGKGRNLHIHVELDP